MPWAIKTNSAEGHGFIGVYWFIHAARLPDVIGGTRIALFRTRAKAREHLSSVKTTFPKATVVEVEVDIDVIPKTHF